MKVWKEENAIEPGDDMDRHPHDGHDVVIMDWNLASHGEGTAVQIIQCHAKLLGSHDHMTRCVLNATEGSTGLAAELNEAIMPNADGSVAWPRANTPSRETMPPSLDDLLDPVESLPGLPFSPIREVLDWFAD